MKNLLTTILTATDFTSFSDETTKKVANIYKINNDMLIRTRNIQNAQGIILGITDDNFSITNNLKKILSDIIFEFKKYKYESIFLDFNQGDYSEFVYKLDEMCFKENIKLFVPHEYAKNVKYSKIIINSAISGGNFEKILEYAQLEYGKDRVCVNISMVAYEFDIPSSEQEGKMLEYPIDTKDNTVFFSNPLCTNYFTYMKSQELCVFTIFDDKSSFIKKMEVLSKLEISEIFIKYEHIKKFTLLS